MLPCHIILLFLTIFCLGWISSAPPVCNIPSSTSKGICVQMKECLAIDLSSDVITPDLFENFMKRQESCKMSGMSGFVCCEMANYVSQNNMMKTRTMNTSTARPTVARTTTFGAFITSTIARKINLPTQRPTIKPPLDLSLTSTNNSIEALTRHKNFRLFDMKICGTQLAKRVANGEDAGLFENPWAARVGYLFKNNITYNCGGTLISEYYVLTAAHCITALRSGYVLKRVRLGEYDERTEIDCDDDENCAEPVQDVEIESVIPYPEYNPTSFHHDIGLIRLANPAKLKQRNIKPICLPLDKNIKQLVPNYIVIGWGATSNSTRYPVLQKAVLSPVTKTECEDKYKRQYLKLIDGQICAVGNGKIDSCRGDSGSSLSTPAMLNKMPRMVQYGIVSFGVRSCGVLDDVPGIYTYVPEYLNWILDNIH